MTSGPQLPLARELAAMLERALNREISESTPAKDLLVDLDGESFAVHVRGTGVTGVLRAKNGRVTVEARWQAAAQSRSRDTPEVRPWGSVRTSLCSQGLGNDSARPPATESAGPPGASRR